MKAQEPLTKVTTVEDEEQLQIIATGLIADDRVNMDEELRIGEKIQDSLKDQMCRDILQKISEQAKKFFVMWKPIQEVAGEVARMSSAELYQKLRSISLLNGPLDPEVVA